jgi:hypothetical protein
MKKNWLLLIVVLLLAIGSSFQVAVAQEKTKTEKEKEEEILKAIDEQKKAMTEAKKAQKEAELELQKISEEQQKAMKDLQISIQSEGGFEDVARIYDSRRPGRSFSTGEPFIFTPGVENWYGFTHGGDGERTTWDFSKSLKENTFSRDYTFDVEKSVNTVVLSVNGDCKSGEIRIKIVMPNGKTYSDSVIEEFGNLNLRKSFTISETENQDKAGEWKFAISSNKATGFFKISLQTY